MKSRWLDLSIFRWAHFLFWEHNFYIHATPYLIPYPLNFHLSVSTQIPIYINSKKFSWSHKSVACSKLFFELSRVPTRWCIIIYHHMHIYTNKRFSTQIIRVATSYLSKMQFAKIQTVASKKSPFWNSRTQWRINGFSNHPICLFSLVW